MKSRAMIYTLLLSFGLLGCTQTVIVYKPNPKMDPLPVVTNKPEADKDDPDFGKQWHMAKMGVTKEILATPLLDGNYNVKIAVLSTGVDYNHEDLRGQIAINTAEITQKAAGDKPGPNREDDDKNGLVDDIVGYDVVDGDGLAYDRHGAGTAVAGLIAARMKNGVGVSGLMKKVQLYPIRYIDDNGQSSVANLASALELAVKIRPHVVFIQNTQFRLGGHDGNSEVASVEASLVKRHLDELQTLKIPVVLGAGDGMSDYGNDEIEKMLKSFDNLIVVTATGKDDNRTLMANFSMTDVLIAAPGEKLFTLKPFNKYGEVSGTGYAAAHVTAALGLARSMLGDRATSEKLIPALLSPKGSDQVPALTPFTRSGTRLNVVKFLNEIKTL
ncbi:MAG: S8 family serine peptidase [Bdellovibrionales bacterium]